MDVAWLEDIFRRQWVHIKKEGLQSTALLEFEVMPAFADMEYYGIHINKNSWLKNIDSSEKGLVEVARQLDEWAVANRYAFYNLKDETGINWDSQQQVLKLLRNVYKELKDTTDKTLEDYHIKYNNPVLALLRDYRELSKQNGTYGANYLKFIHPVTGKIHPKFNQYGAATGRPSGKEPNMLNIPRDKRYREAFIAPEGYDIHTKDYSGCELRIVASMSKDKAMCDAYNRGMDLHTYVAAQFMRKDYEALNALVKAKDEEACNVRQACKSLNFGGW
jgi:DNA polymerase-1